MRAPGLARRRGYAVAMMLAIALLSLLPGAPEDGDSGFIWLIDVVPPVLQNTMHVVLYAVLTMTWTWALEGRAKATTHALLIAVIYGVLLEVGQLWVPGRFATLLDAGLNSAGAVCALVLVTSWQARHAVDNRQA